MVFIYVFVYLFMTFDDAVGALSYVASCDGKLAPSSVCLDTEGNDAKPIGCSRRV